MSRLKARWAALGPGLARFGRHLRRGAPAYGVLLISLLLTVIAWYNVRQSVDAQNRARFEEATQAATSAIARRMNRNLDVMHSARALLLVSDSVDREEWNRYVGIVTGIEPERLWWRSGLQSLGFAKYVRPEEREALSREAREEGGRDLWPDGERSAYFPLEFVAPSSEANRRMMGYDVYSDPAHQSVMDRARDTDTVEFTRMDYVLTDAASHSEADVARRKGFVVYLPVYQEGEPTGTVAERRSALQGFIVGTFICDELLAGVFKGAFHPLIDFEVYDGPNPTSSPLLYDSDGILRGREQHKENAASGSLFSGRTAQGETGEDALFARES